MGPAESTQLQNTIRDDINSVSNPQLRCEYQSAVNHLEAISQERNQLVMQHAASAAAAVNLVSQLMSIKLGSLEAQA